MNAQSNALMPVPRLTPDAIRARAEQPAIAVDVAHLHGAALCQAVEAQLKEVFVVTQQLCDVLGRLLDTATGHADSRYPSETEYWQRINTTHPVVDVGTYSDLSATLVTGLPGIGKSAMVNALKRVLTASELVLPSQNVRIPTVPVINLRLAASSAEKAMVRTLHEFFTGARPPNARMIIHDLCQVLSRLMFKHGTLWIILDELQFLSHSEGSIQKAINFLINTIALKVPLGYCANYSLVHKLMKRHSEEKQRLLANVIEIFPEPGDSDDWRKIVAEAKKVAPSIFSYDPVNDAPQLFRWTAGLGRLLRHLLIGGLKLVASDKTPKVTMAVLQRAFHSTEYTSNREDVEVIINFGISSAGHKARPDLWSPFPRNRQSDRFSDSATAARLKQQTLAAAMSTLPHVDQRQQIESLKSAPAAPVVSIRKSSRRNQIADNTTEALAEIRHEVVTP